MGFFEKMKSSKRETTTKDSLKERFKEEQTKEIQELPSTRTVILKYGSSCGCGGNSMVDIMREVPYDSNLRDGDRIYELKKGDVEL